MDVCVIMTATYTAESGKAGVWCLSVSVHKKMTVGHFIFCWDKSLKLYSETKSLVWVLTNMQQVK